MARKKSTAAPTATPIIVTPPPPPPPTKPASVDLKTSDAGIRHIKGFESLKLKAYRCPVGKWTIGYGTTRGVQAGDSVTAAEAEALLREDVADAEDAVLRLVKVPLSQGEFDALVSFVHNAGEGNLASSTLLRCLNASQRARAADQFLRWDKGRVNGKLTVLAGLARRRRAERTMFLNPEWPA